MVGDEVVAEFAGEVFSNHVSTTEAVQRFHPSSLRLKYLTIEETVGIHKSYIGLYNPNRALFIAKAYILPPSGVLILHYVDLYNLGHAWHTAAAHPSMIGTY
jgi:hypothetical protein